VFARPEYHWVARRQPLLWLTRLWYRAVDWINTLAGDHPTAFTLLMAALVVVLVVLLVHAGYVVSRMLRRPSGPGAGAPAAGAAVVLDARSHLARAEALARAGRYAEALGHQFLAVVLQLERADAVRFNASKTPAEYVGEVRLDDAGRTTFAALVASLYRHLFGAVPCDEVEYREFGATARQVTRHVLPA
jgi:hypothetical protein